MIAQGLATNVQLTHTQSIVATIDRDIEKKLDEADYVAKNHNIRLSHHEVFSSLRRKLNA